MILTCNRIKKSFGAEDILNNISFIIEEKEKAAIIGVNGAGKTTLFRIIAGELEHDGGEVFLKKDTVVKYMPQNMTFDSKMTIYDEMLLVFEDILALETTMRNLEMEMGIAKDTQLQILLEKYNRVTHQFEEKNGYEYQSRVKGIIKGLGFSEADFTKKISLLSGGEKTRVALGKILLSQPDLLLLDEPTNHLDLTSIAWLEAFLQNYSGAIVIISHDRYFLDKVVTKVIEIENKKSVVYPGNYTDYSVQKEVNREIALKHYINQQKEIKRQEEIIKVLRSYNRERFFKRAQSREKLLMKMERVEKPEDLPDKMRIILEPKRPSGNDVLYAEDLSKCFGSRRLFQNVALDIKKGEKVALIGPNGIGKTTIIRMIRNLIQPDTGHIKLGTNVQIGYYDQECQNINMEKTIFDEIYDTYPTMTVTEIRNTLAAFVFTGDDVYKPINLLSGGEKGRVALAKIMLSNANFLILDEPTNHLDMYSKDILEEALNGYTGTVLYVSHDRYFINSTADKILELTPDGITIYLGNYDFYLEKANEPAKQQLVTYSENKNQWSQKKEEQAEERKRKAALSKCENEIMEMEKEIEYLSRELDREEVYSSPELSSDYYGKKTEAEDKLLSLYIKWNELAQ